jgi:prevent-host-death family protein
MTTIGTYEAKTKLPDLLHRVEAGESFTITRNGKPVAKLVPFEERSPGKTATDIVKAFREIRERSKNGQPSIQELINQGRRF